MNFKIFNSKKLWTGFLLIRKNIFNRNPIPTSFTERG